MRWSRRVTHSVIIRTFIVLMALATTFVGADHVKENPARIAINGLHIGMCRVVCDSLQASSFNARPYHTWWVLFVPSITYSNSARVDQDTTVLFDQNDQASILRGNALSVDDKDFRLGAPMESVITAIALPFAAEDGYSDYSVFFDENSSFDEQCLKLGLRGSSPKKIVTSTRVFYKCLGLTVTFSVLGERSVLNSAELVIIQ